MEEEMKETKFNEENDNKDVKENEEEGLTMKASFKKKLAKKDEEVALANKESALWKDKYYRAFADIDNLRKDIDKDHKEVIKYRIEGFVDKLLGVLDAFDIAFKFQPTNPETKNYLQGFQYVYSQLLDVLTGEGIQIIEPKIGDKFDEKVMHAVETCDDEGEEHLIKEVKLKGYKLYDHIIRAAMVVTTIHPKTNDVKPTEENDKNIA